MTNDLHPVSICRPHAYGNLWTPDEFDAFAAAHVDQHRTINDWEIEMATWEPEADA